MDLSLKRPNASKVFALEIIAGAPIIGDYLEKDLKDWVDRQASVLKKWQSRGQMTTISQQHIFFMIWAVTQTYDDFNTQIKAVWGVDEVSHDEHTTAVETVTEVVLRGRRVKRKGKIKSPEGTQTVKLFILTGKVIIPIRGCSQGDLLCRAVIETPQNLSKPQKQILKDVQDSISNDSSQNPLKAEWFSKVKSFFDTKN